MNYFRKYTVWLSIVLITGSMAVALCWAQDDETNWTQDEPNFVTEEAPMVDDSSWAPDAELALFNLPDLKVHSIGAPSSASRGALISVSDVTTNVGTANATASTTKMYICSNPNNVTVNDMVGNHAVSGIAKGKSWPWAGSVTVPAGRPLGTNYYVVVANADHLVGELNYNNNTNYVVIVINP